jgi:hypothetical protein
MTTLEEMNEFIERLSSSLPKRIPRKIEMTTGFYNRIHRDVPLAELTAFSGVLGKLTAIPIFLKEDLEVPWIMYDQYNEEMARAS